MRAVVATGIVVASLVFIVHARRFFTFDAAALGKYAAWKAAIMGHIMGGTVALVVGPFQLSKKVRAKFLRAHRTMGKVYVGGTTLGAVSALVLASTTARSVGIGYALSLHVLASVWLASSLLAWRTARGVGHAELHRDRRVRAPEPRVRSPARRAHRSAVGGGGDAHLDVVDDPDVRLRMHAAPLRCQSPHLMRPGAGSVRVCTADAGTKPQFALSSPCVQYQTLLPPACGSPGNQQSNQLLVVRR